MIQVNRYRLAMTINKLLKFHKHQMYYNHRIVKIIQTLEPIWRDVDENLNSSIIFNPNNENVGINSDIIETLINGTPYDFYFLFLDYEI